MLYKYWNGEDTVEVEISDYEVGKAREGSFWVCVWVGILAAGFALDLGKWPLNWRNYGSPESLGALAWVAGLILSSILLGRIRFVRETITDWKLNALASGRKPAKALDPEAEKAEAPAPRYSEEQIDSFFAITSRWMRMKMYVAVAFCVLLDLGTDLTNAVVQSGLVAEDSLLAKPGFWLISCSLMSNWLLYVFYRRKLDRIGQNIIRAGTGSTIPHSSLAREKGQDDSTPLPVGVATLEIPAEVKGRIVKRASILAFLIIFLPLLVAYLAFRQDIMDRIGVYRAIPIAVILWMVFRTRVVSRLSDLIEAWLRRRAIRRQATVAA